MTPGTPRPPRTHRSDHVIASHSLDPKTADARSVSDLREDLQRLAVTRSLTRLNDIRVVLESLRIRAGASVLRTQQRTAVDLFSGAGGATQGLRIAGYKVLAAVESDPVAAATYVVNHPRVRVYTQDIRELEAETLLHDLNLRRGEIAVLKACPPCQGFSSLRRGRVADERNDLVREVWRFIEVLRPLTFAVENVPGLRHDARLELLIRQARAIGYRVRDYVVDAHDFGVPQRRRRLLVLGVRSPDASAFPTDLREVLPHAFRRPAPDALAVLTRGHGWLPEGDVLHRPRSHSPMVQLRLQTLPVNGDRFSLPLDQQLECHIKLGRRAATASYGRIPTAGPSPTMTTRCTTPACGAFVHPTEPRAITLREAALLQTFPPQYRFVGFYDEIERQIGNALPVKLGEAVGRCLSALSAPASTQGN